MFAFVIALGLAGFVQAADEVSESSYGRFFQNSYARFSTQTSRSTVVTDYRTLKTFGTDESGNMSEKTVLPNQSFVSFFGVLNPSENHQLMVAALQSIDKEETRVISTPFAPRFELPGRIAVARYRYNLNENFNLSLAAIHIDVFGFSDPYFGLNYVNRTEGGWMNRAGLSLSAPITERSRTEDLYTKATLRLSTGVRNGPFLSMGGISHARPFYKDPSILDRSTRPTTPAPTNGRPARRPPPLPRLDQVLTEKENSRTTAWALSNFAVTRKLTLGMYGTMSYVTTFKDKYYWVTGFKPLTVSYLINSLELGGEVGLTSDIEKYRSPSLPKEVTVGLSLSYSFGKFPYSI